MNCIFLFQILLCLFLPIFLPFIKFTSNTKAIDIIDGDEDDDDEDDDCPSKVVMERSTGGSNKVGPNNEEGEVEFAPTGSPRHNKTKLFKVNMFDFSPNTINIWSAILYFYSAPITKFFFNLVSREFCRLRLIYLFILLYM